MRSMPFTLALALGSSVVVMAGPACNCGLEQLAPVFPRMIVQPSAVTLQDVPVAQDTRIVVQIHDPSIADLKELHFELQAPVDPTFRMEDGAPVEVFAGQTGEVAIIARPRTVAAFHAVLVVTAQDDAKPNRVEVPIDILSIDAGVPVICGYPDSISFPSVGRGDTARASVPIKNCGVRDLLVDSIEFCPTPLTGETADANGCGPNTEITFIEIPAHVPVGPQESITVELDFRPTDLDRHEGTFIIHSNDPVNEPVLIPVNGQGVECPTACIELVDGADGIQPFDTVRIDGRCSTPAGNTTIEQYNWVLDQRPIGSTTNLTELGADRTELPVDLAGTYCVHLDVTDTDGVGSCAAALQCFDVIPNEDLHVQLVWDHPSADLDLHVVAAGGDPFTHESDCYFSNRHPTPASCAPTATTCAWSADPDQNPSLDHDDHEGYGPENTNIIHPAPGSKWRLLVHYWNKQTDGDARTTATVRVFVYGQQVMELQFIFEDDQQLWQAVDITWPDVEGDPATLSQLGVVEPFPRPF